MGEFITFAISGISTFLLLFFRKKQYQIKWVHIVALLIVVGSLGYLGAILGSYLSYGSWRGIRFYSKALFVTIALISLAKIFKKPTAEILDYYAPVDIWALVIMKVSCLQTGCCAGIYLFQRDDGTVVQFPSQLSEMSVAFIIFAIIVYLEQKSKCNGYRYYLYLLMYGISRYVFDYFRVTPTNSIHLFGMSISITQIFCVILVMIGAIGICKGIRENIKSR